MSKKDRVKELIELFADADTRNELSKAQMAYCPTIGEVLDAVMGE